MSRAIDHISINDDFWIQIRGHLISFGFKGLPDSIHYTISYNDRTPDINFHVTKNIASQENKPQIKVFEIEKTLLEEDIPSLIRVVLNKLLHPLDINELKNKFDSDLGFISFDNLSQPDYQSITEKELIANFKDITKIRKGTRLKINGDVRQQLENFAGSKEVQAEIFNNIVDIPHKASMTIEGGIIISEDTTIHVIRIYEKWYEFKADFNPGELLDILFETALRKKIVWKTRRAIISVKNAMTYSDVKHLNKPIRLIKQHKKRV